MPEIAKQFFASDRLSRHNLSEQDAFGRIEEIIYSKGNKTTLINQEKVGRFQFRVLKTIGAILACFTNKHVGYIETLLMNCDDTIAQDENELEFAFEEHTRIPYKRLVATPKEIVALAQIIENIIHRTETKYPEMELEHRGKKMEDVELVLWE